MKYLLSTLISLLLISCSTKNISNYSQIEYEAGACYGFCPIFKLTIQPDRSAVIEAERFTFTEGSSKDDFSTAKEGTYKTTISPENFQELVALLEKADLKTLKNKYDDKKVSDLPTSFLRVKYLDGTSKSIEDYGKQATPDLRNIYEFMEELRFKEKWQKVD